MGWDECRFPYSDLHPCLCEGEEKDAVERLPFLVGKQAEKVGTGLYRRLGQLAPGNPGMFFRIPTTLRPLGLDLYCRYMRRDGGQDAILL